MVFNAFNKNFEGKDETIEHADILNISKEATEVPKVQCFLEKKGPTRFSCKTCEIFQALVNLVVKVKQSTETYLI